jgi:D-alanyl-D-alanine carboxypeptidase
MRQILKTKKSENTHATGPKTKCESYRPAPITRGAAGILLVAFALSAFAQAPADLATAKQSRIEAIVRSELKSTGVPSASIAIVENSHLAYSKTFGRAQISPERAADSAMRYGIGSISKEFLATALLMLESERRISLDDKVSQYVQNLGAAGQATLRQLLQHTAGIRDYWPQDYVFADMRNAITHEALLDRWARQPVDFAPGERWQYSNTGYVLAGVVLEKVTGQSLFEFLKERIFVPLKMKTVVDNDNGGMGSEDATGYTAFGLGPLQRAPAVGPGWLFAAGELAMTAEDLARWDISIINQSLMSSNAYHALEQETLLNNGAGTRYALGLGVRLKSERRVLSHGGGVSGFITQNVIYPDAHAAIVVFTNTDTADAASTIADKIEDVLFVTESPEDASKSALARKIFSDMRKGKIDRTLFSTNGNEYYTAKAVADTARALSLLGPLKSFELKNSGTRGGMDVRTYKVKLTKKTFDLVVRQWPDGKYEQFMLLPT